MLRVLLFLLLVNINPNAKVSNRTVRRSFVSAVFSNKIPIHTTNTFNRTGACRWLRGLKHQNKLCRKRKGFSEVLQNARFLAVSHCRAQFEYDRWNCTNAAPVAKGAYRESAFLHSLAAAALVYSVARACSDGRLLNCRCAPPPAGRRGRLPADARWGGCGDNVRDAARIARRFLAGPRGSGREEVGDDVLEYDGEVGMRAVEDNNVRVCPCHGVSGSCAMKTCYKRLRPFGAVAEKLKAAYQEAVRFDPSDPLTALRSRRRSLVYLEPSPDFCRTTSGRRCKDEDHCATMCCGRGHLVVSELVSRQCRCRYQECCFNVKCEVCREREEVYVCK